MKYFIYYSQSIFPITGGQCNGLLSGGPQFNSHHQPLVIGQHYAGATQRTHCHGHDCGNASIVWQVSLSYIAELFWMHCRQHCHCHDHDMTTAVMTATVMTADLSQAKSICGNDLVSEHQKRACQFLQALPPTAVICYLFYLFIFYCILMLCRNYVKMKNQNSE